MYKCYLLLLSPFLNTSPSSLPFVHLLFSVGAVNEAFSMEPVESSSADAITLTKYNVNLDQNGERQTATEPKNVAPSSQGGEASHPSEEVCDIANDPGRLSEIKLVTGSGRQSR